MSVQSGSKLPHSKVTNYWRRHGTIPPPGTGFTVLVIPSAS